MKKLVRKVLGKSFPDDGEKQLWGGLGAVFASWNGMRAIKYREVEGIPHEWGTAVNVQTMVFGNMGDTCATGVAFSRDPGRDVKDIFYGEYLVNAQGEDVVAGIRTPAPINKASQSADNKDLVTLEKLMPGPYKELNAIQKRLERHYRDMQDIEFTIEDHKLFMLQCRVGKRNGTAAVRIAVDMVKEKLITVKEAVCRVTGDQLDEWLHDILDPKEEAKTKAVARGLPAGPGGAQGKIVFTSEEAVAVAAEGEDVILVRAETNPEDVDGMWAAQAILTERGGMTSHAALVARGWGKCCIVGCAELDIDAKRKTLKIGKRVFKSGDSLSLNGSTGNVYAGNFATIPPDTGGKTLSTFLKMCDKLRTLNVRTNAETPADAALARGFGAEGIGLFRTEHMFYGGDPEALACLRRMILSGDRKAQQKAINQLFRFVKKDIKGTLKAMKGLPVTIRLLDPPLHEFIPHEDKDLRKIARELKTPFAEVKKRADSLHEVNPMMGHRGVRLGITHPEVTEMYVRAILESAGELSKKGIRVFPEIMVPVVAVETEMAHQFELIKGVHKTVCKKLGVRKVNHMVGTMIETPRACLISKKLVQQGAEFFSFGTNDLTQMTFGFSRDDIGGFMGEYLDQGIMAADPFGTLDKGVKKLVKKGVKKGRKVDPKLKIGICGEHGGDPASVKFCHKVGMNYVSCSPYRVPIARLAAAQAVAEE
jgi:pyruvate,orthophosphate dikinase